MAETLEVLQRAGTSRASRSGPTTAWSPTPASSPTPGCSCRRPESARPFDREPPRHLIIVVLSCRPPSAGTASASWPGSCPGSASPSASCSARRSCPSVVRSIRSRRPGDSSSLLDRRRCWSWAVRSSARRSACSIGSATAPGVLPLGPVRQVDAGGRGGGRRARRPGGGVAARCRPWPTSPAGRPSRPATSRSAKAIDGLVPSAARHARHPAALRRRDASRRCSTLCVRRRSSGPPPAASGLDPATASRVARSTVKVEGEACDRIQEGSGFVVGPDLVVTNAHVVAGEGATQLQRSDGTAVERKRRGVRPRARPRPAPAPGLDRPALPLGAHRRSAPTGAVFGHPGGGPLRLAPFQVGRRVRGHRQRHLRPGRRSPRRPVPRRPPLARATRAPPWSTRTAESSAWPSPSRPTSPDVAYARSSTTELRAGARRAPRSSTGASQRTPTAST